MGKPANGAIYRTGWYMDHTFAKVRNIAAASYHFTHWDFVVALQILEYVLAIIVLRAVDKLFRRIPFIVAVQGHNLLKRLSRTDKI